MVKMIVGSIVDEMEKDNLFEKEMKEHYVYALTTMIEKWITTIFILAMGVLAKQIVPMILFLIFFFSLRKRTGGYHADSYGQCFCGTMGICITIIFTVPILLRNMWVVYGLLIGSIILICLIGTVNHPNLDMDHYELRQSNKSARILLCLESSVIIAADSLGICKVWICYMAIAIILCAFLLCLAKILKQEVQHYEKE